MKVVINKGIGGFGLSHKAIMRYAEMAGIWLLPAISRDKDDENDTIFAPYFDDCGIEGLYYFIVQKNDDRDFTKGFVWDDRIELFNDFTIERHDPYLLNIVEEMGEDADGDYSRLAIVEIPDDVEYIIMEREDGFESIHEKHMVWW